MSPSTFISATGTLIVPITRDKDLIKFHVKILFEKHVPKVLSERQSQLADANSVFLFEIISSESKNIQDRSRPPYYWTIDLRKGVTYPGKPGPNQAQADTTFVLKEDSVIQLLTGKLTPADAFISNQLKLLGNSAAVFKFHHFWNCPPQSAQEVASYYELVSRLAALELKPAAAAKAVTKSAMSPEAITESSDASSADVTWLESIPTDGLKSDVVFDIIRARFAEESELIKKMPILIQFNITKNGQSITTWTMDTKSKPGTGLIFRSALKNGRKPDAAITIDDLDYVRLLFGKLNPQKAFMNRKLKITGNVMLLQRLDNLWNQIQKTRHDPELPFVKDLLLDENQFKSGIKSEIVIFDMLQRLVRLPNLMPASSTLRLVITLNRKPQVSWLIVYNEQAKLAQLKRQSMDGQYLFSPVDIQLTMEDLDFVRLCRNPSFTLSKAIQKSLVTLEGDRAAELLPKIESRLFQNPDLVSKL